MLAHHHLIINIDYLLIYLGMINGRIFGYFGSFTWCFSVFVVIYLPCKYKGHLLIEK